MFDHTTIDFGTVARGAKVEGHFTVENVYEEDVHIASVSSSCGCTSAKISKQTLKTWEKAQIDVAVDTRNEPGHKSATITVLFDKPFQHETQLHVYSNIRGDVVVQPGVVQFGTINQGAGASETCRVTYAGRDGWRIVGLETPNPAIEATAVELSRNAGQADYNLTVKLKPNAPSGYVQGPLVVVTNDENAGANHIPIPVEGYVTPALTVRPGSLMFSSVAPGKSATQNLVVQGRRPFHVTAVRSSDPRFTCKTPGDAKMFHVLPVVFSPGMKTSADKKITATVTIETDVANIKPIEIDVAAQQ